MSRLSTKPEPAPDVSFPLTSAPLARALAERDYSDPTPVQNAVLAPEPEGRDLLVSAQTGPGKTVAYGIALAPPLLGEAEKLGTPSEPLVPDVVQTCSVETPAQQDRALPFRPDPP